MMVTVEAATAVIVLWILTQFLLLPYIRMELRRRASRTHTPQPEEIWVQDGELLYIDSVDAFGVEVLRWDPQNKTMFRWKDTWAEWQQRCQNKVLWYTGERRPLGSA